MFTIAAYCQKESRKAGTIDAQYKAAIQLIREALHDMRRIDASPIEVTQHKTYRVWWRLKLKNAPAVTYRAIVEIAENGVLLHLVLPRTSSTYAEVETLWKAQRTALPDA